jgi:NRPS condensation-like uncharacterized protein
MVLPLALVPFEYYMLADDRPSHPMTFFYRLRFTGELDRTFLASALNVALARHPLLGAVVRPEGKRKLVWAVAEGLPNAPQWSSSATESRERICPFLDVRRENGLRIWVDQQERQTLMTLQFHHACCDGLGAFRFLDDLFVAYAQAAGEPTVKDALRRLEPDQLRHRGEFGLTLWKYLKRFHKELVGVSGIRKFFRHAPTPLGLNGANPAEELLPSPFPTSVTKVLDGDELERLRLVAKTAGVTVNDLFIRDLFLAIGRWLSRHQQGDPRRWLRLSIPMNMRTVADRRLPAANVVAMVFLDRQLREFADSQQLLAGVHDEMQLIKRLDLGLTFANSLRLFSALPGGIELMVPTNKCQATMVLTNLGAPLDKSSLPTRDGRLVVGKAILEGIEILAPIRPYSNAAIALFEYADKLGITLHYDSRRITPDQARDLLNGYVRQVQDTLGATINVSAK